MKPENQEIEYYEFERELVGAINNVGDGIRYLSFPSSGDTFMGFILGVLFSLVIYILFILRLK